MSSPSTEPDNEFAPAPLNPNVARPVPAQAWSASLIAHEIRAPIGALRSLVEMIDLHWHSHIPPGAMTLWNALQAEAERLYTLAESLLDLASAQYAAPMYARVDLDHLVGEIVRQLGAEYPLANIRVEPLGVVEADEQLLKCLWRNLIGNALKYSQRTSKPRVVVRSRTHGRYGFREFSVMDNGIGIPDVARDRIFEPFNRSAMSREFEGHGLGLPAVRAIARAHGGNAWIGRDPSLGTELCFSLRHPADTVDSD
jgi:signal transduction histidine kinase